MNTIRLFFVISLILLMNTYFNEAFTQETLITNQERNSNFQK